MQVGGDGTESITFVPDSEHPEGGLFYIGNQVFDLTLENDISAIFQMEIPLQSTSGEPKLIGYFSPGVVDLSGLHYDSATDHIFVVSDTTNTVFEYSRDHILLGAYSLSGNNQEGITFDKNGFAYIAQDSGGILKMASDVGKSDACCSICCDDNVTAANDDNSICFISTLAKTLPE